MNNGNDFSPKNKMLPVKYKNAVLLALLILTMLIIRSDNELRFRSFPYVEGTFELAPIKEDVYIGELNEGVITDSARVISIAIEKKVTNLSNKNISAILIMTPFLFINSDTQKTGYIKTETNDKNSFGEGNSISFGAIKPNESAVVITKIATTVLKLRKDNMPYDTTFDSYTNPTLDNDIRKYLYPCKYIESDNRDIVSVAFELKSKSDSPQELIEDIVNYTKRTVRYDAESVFKNKGALSALNNKEGICQEYADLTVALLRASGIPSRVCTGFIVSNAEYTDDWADASPFFHDWVEVYIPDYGWLTIDPTNSKTTLYTLNQHPDELLMTMYYDDYYIDYVGAHVPGTYNYSQTMKYVDGLRDS